MSTRTPPKPTRTHQRPTTRARRERRPSRWVAAAIVAVLAVVAGLGIWALVSDDDTDEVTALVDRMLVASNEDDEAALREVFTPGALFEHGDGQQYDGIDEVLAVIRGGDLDLERIGPVAGPAEGGSYAAFAFTESGNPGVSVLRLADGRIAMMKVYVGFAIGM